MPDPHASAVHLPGSAGERELQRMHGTEQRARAFYEHQMLDRLSPEMGGFVGAQELMFVSTADAAGNCDCSIRAGSPGFVAVLDEKTLAYPEFRGNGVMATLGNITENPHIGLLFVDFFVSTVGCHVNGTARIVENSSLLATDTALLTALREIAERTLESAPPGRQPERWVVVHVEEAYIHCAKHIPRLARQTKDIAWGTDDVQAKGGDFFRVKGLPRPWRSAEC